MTATIIPSEDFSVAASNWKIIKQASAEIMWTSRGGGVGMVVDSDGYLAAFESMFPLVVARWGAGPLRLEAIVEGAVIGRIANLNAFWIAPDLDTANAAKREIKSGIAEPSFMTRTTRKSTDNLPMRTHTGTLQGDSGEVKAVGPDAPPDIVRARLAAGLNADGTVKCPVILPTPGQVSARTSPTISKKGRGTSDSSYGTSSGSAPPLTRKGSVVKSDLVTIIEATGHRPAMSVSSKLEDWAAITSGQLLYISITNVATFRAGLYGPFTEPTQIKQFAAEHKIQLPADF